MEARPPNDIELRQTIRIRRSTLLDAKLENLDRPSLKIAKTFDEYMQSFSILYSEYLASKYLNSTNRDELYFSVYNLLPKTCVFLFKSYLTVLSTMTFIPDTPEFGLPMDDIYNAELDTLRRKGHKIAEIGSLATRFDYRGQNLIMFLAKAIFQYAVITGIDDLCITVNPKHVRFYKTIFLFVPFGEKRFYDKVGAPAVALRVNMRRIEPALLETYGASDFDTNLHAFFTRVNAHSLATGLESMSAEKNEPLEDNLVKRLMAARPTLLHGLSNEQCTMLKKYYPNHKITCL